MFAASTSLAGGKTGILAIPKSRNLGFDSPCYGAGSVQSQGHGVSITGYYRVLGNKGEGGAGDTRISNPSEMQIRFDGEHESMLP